MIVLYKLILYTTDARVSAFDFEDRDILKLKKALDINKAQGLDNTSIYMLQFYNSDTFQVIGRDQKS